MTKIEKLLMDMLNISSVSGDEKAMGEFLYKELSTDFTVKKQKVAKDRYNIIAHKGKSDVYIVVHMDVVPGDVPVKMTKDKIFGRGAIDNKGNIAGAIMAARETDDIGLIFTVGEEVDFIGAKKVKKPEGKKVIVMEPTKLRVARAQRGVIGIAVEAHGTQMHSSLKFTKNQSAVYVLTKFLQDVYAKNWTACNAVIKDGGAADNIVAPYAQAEILIRPKNMEEYQEVTHFIKRSKRKNVTLKTVISVEPCKSTLVKRGDTVSYFSEMAFFDNSILFGVGNILQAHTPDEFVKRKDLNALPEKLLELIEQLRNG